MVAYAEDMTVIDARSPEEIIEIIRDLESDKVLEALLEDLNDEPGTP
jgi:hypothetical protein